MGQGMKNKKESGFKHIQELYSVLADSAQNGALLANYLSRIRSAKLFAHYKKHFNFRILSIQIQTFAVAHVFQSKVKIPWKSNNGAFDMASTAL